MRRQRLGRHDRGITDLVGRRERVEEVDVELVDGLSTVRAGCAIDTRPPWASVALDQRLRGRRRQDALGRPQADAVVAGEEVEPGGGRR